MADKELVLFAVHCVLLLFIPLYFEGLARDWQGIDHSYDICLKQRI